MSNWLPSPPIGVGIVIALMLLSAGLWEHEKQQAICRNNTSDKDCSRIYEYVGHAIIPPIANVVTPPRNQKPERDQWRSEQDLRAQWEMARFTLWAAFAAWAGVFVTIVGIFYVRQTLEANRAAVKEAEKASAITRESGQAQVRAYVSVSDFSLSITEERRPIVEFNYMNTGQSPARFIEINVRIVVTQPPYNFPIHVSDTLQFPDDLSAMEKRPAKITCAVIEQSRFDVIQNNTIKYDLFGTIKFLDVFKKISVESFQYFPTSGKGNDLSKPRKLGRPPMIMQVADSN